MRAAMNTFKFPVDFFWGTSTAAHQVEGNNVNSDWWLLESIPDLRFERSGDACDHYHRYEEDIRIFSELGLNAYRFSIEWARIEPEKGLFSIAELDHYKRVIETCLEHGITPIVTFHHFTSPRWIAFSGGWTTVETAKRFGEYVQRATRHLGDLIEWACTLNEPNITPVNTELSGLPDVVLSLTGMLRFRLRSVVGGFPRKFGTYVMAPDDKGFPVITVAHRLARQAIKSEAPSIKVGWSLAIVALEAVAGGEKKLEQLKYRLYGRYFEHCLEDDYLGVQNYSRARIGPRGKVAPPKGAEMTQRNEEFYPGGLEWALRYAAKHVDLPILVTENGVPIDDDRRREEFIRQVVCGVANCLLDEIDVRGYLYWSAFDNYEWGTYEKTYGIIAINRSTFERQLKPSAALLGEIAKNNRIALLDA